MHVVKRHHDNEDHNNKNHIIDNAGLASLGPNYFDKNTGFFWKFEWGASGKLPFKFGVIGTAPLPGIPIIFYGLMMKTEKTPIRLLGGPAQIVLKGLIYQQKKIFMALLLAEIQDTK